MQHFHDKVIHQDYDAVNQTNYFRASPRIYFDKQFIVHRKISDHEKFVLQKSSAESSFVCSHLPHCIYGTG